MHKSKPKACRVCGNKNLSDLCPDKNCYLGVKNLCKRCAADKRSVYRKSDLAKEKQIQKRTRINRRKKIYKAYGNKCAVCGESRFEFLSIDHIHNDGAEHRRRVGEGEMVYTDIIRNNYPDTYQLLCHNCHGAKSWHTSNPIIAERETRSQIEGLHGEGI